DALLCGRAFLAWQHAFAQAPRPTLLDRLPSAPERERIRGHIVSDNRARADISAIPDLHRRDQRRIRADECVLADLGAMRGHAFVVPDAGAGAESGARADRCIADVAQVIGLGTGLDHRLLDLDEITDVDVVLQAGARAQPRIGTDQRPFTYVRAIEVRERA